MSHDPKEIANFFIETATSEGEELTPLKVIKLVYIAHGWHLALTERPLISEPPEAWKYGPVIPSLYQALKIYGNDPVTEPIARYLPSEPAWIYKKRTIPSPGDPRMRRFLKSVWESYKRFTGSQLSTLTHQPNTPWSETWNTHGARYTKGVDIPEDLIKAHYKELKAKNAERSAAKRT